MVRPRELSGELSDRELSEMRERGLGLFGTREQMNEQIRRYAAIGVEHLALVTRLGGMDAAAPEFSLRELAP